MKAYLVTGGAGFIGSNFVELLVKQGHRCIVLDLFTYAGHLENLVGIEGPGTLEIIRGDINDGNLVAKLLAEQQVDGIINFAAESHVDRSIEKPSGFIETNINGTFTLLNVALGYYRTLADQKKKSFRYLQVSTDEVFGALELNHSRFHEGTPLAPNSPYSASKAAGDLLVRAWHHTYGLPTVTTRCSNNYGPKQYPEKLIPLMISNALEGKPLPVYGSGRNIRDWIHVEDHCRGVLAALEKGKPGETYCFGGNAEKENIEVVRTICKELDQIRPRTDGLSHEERIRFVQDRLGHDFRYAIDDRYAEKELGFERKYQFEDGLKQTIHWYLDHEAWRQSVLSPRKPEYVEGVVQ